MAKGKFWTQAEDDILQAEYPTASGKRLLALLPGRDLKGIRCRACRLGVTKSPDARENGLPFSGSMIGHLTEVEKAYLAGIIDGEGCIRLSQHKGRLGTVICHIQVQIANTSPLLLKWLERKLPGAAYSISRSVQGDRKPAYSWIVAWKSTGYRVFREISPYLVIKREQAMPWQMGTYPCPETTV